MVKVIEYAAFGTVVVANLLFGLYFSFRRAPLGTTIVSKEVEVFLGSRALRVLPLAASSVASLLSSTGLIGFPAHHYAYGMHVTWSWVPILVCLPLATQVVVPLIYKLGVTSIFEYLRLRFNNAISLTACSIYIFLTQSVAAISIFAASITLATVFRAPLFWCNICIGLGGTFYTALGGLRGVVWMDCLQLLIILIAPAALLAKISIDSLSESASIKPLTDFSASKYFADFSLDLTRDENVWSYVFGLSASTLCRMCFDQVIVQRQLACRTLKEAKRTAVTGTALLLVMYVFTHAMGFALIVWFRGCDPGLLGDIKGMDQILPYYVNKYLVGIPGVTGLFLAGVVCAATSTVSSTINSQAAIMYVDVIAPRYKKAEKHVLWITRSLAFLIGVIMTIYSTICVYLGSLSRIFMMASAAFAAPYVGLCLLAVLFPFVHSKGAGVSTLLVAIYQISHMTQVIKSGKTPPRMEVSLEYCSANITAALSAVNSSEPGPTELITEPQEVFFLFRLSFLWSSFFAIFATIFGGILLSALTGEMRSEGVQPHLTSDILTRLWRRCRRTLFRGDDQTPPRETSTQTCPANQAETNTLLTNDSETRV
ncbi:sodium-coupled monocarboxylate transporter 2-like isoform X1 [Haemaphysalis longicornis]